MNKVVLDTSVLIALLNGERVDDLIIPLLEGAYMSAVNLAELFTWLSEGHSRPAQRAEQILSLLEEIVPFGIHEAKAVANLRPITKSAGLSLGDRACIALAIELDADVYTADRAWTAVNLPCRVHLVR